MPQTNFEKKYECKYVFISKLSQIVLTEWKNTDKVLNYRAIFIKVVLSLSFITKFNKRAMIAMDQTIAGAASGEDAINRGAEGFIISGKRTEEYWMLFVIFI